MLALGLFATPAMALVASPSFSSLKPYKNPAVLGLRESPFELSTANDSQLYSVSGTETTTDVTTSTVVLRWESYYGAYQSASASSQWVLGYRWPTLSLATYAVTLDDGTTTTTDTSVGLSWQVSKNFYAGLALAEDNGYEGNNNYMGLAYVTPDFLRLEAAAYNGIDTTGQVQHSEFYDAEIKLGLVVFGTALENNSASGSSTRSYVGYEPEAMGFTLLFETFDHPNDSTFVSGRQMTVGFNF